MVDVPVETGIMDARKRHVAAMPHKQAKQHS